MARLPELVRDSQLDILSGETWNSGKQIGAGGSGSVWLEVCISGRRKGAVRAVKRIFLGSNSVTDGLYIRELETIAKFSRPKYEQRFVQFFGWYESLGNLCIAMEYCEFGDLQRYLFSAPRLPETQVQEITFQILEGIRYMHENEFAHRDLKPGNILIKSKPPDPWWIKIADFGISKRIEESLGMPSTVKGTPQFMAPELLGLATLSPSLSSESTNQCAADMWSLGEIVFQMLTKKPAFPQRSQLILYIQGSHPFPNFLLTQCGVSSCGQDFILSAMQLSPDSRLKALQACNHEWMEKFKPSHLSSCIATPARIGGGEEEVHSVSEVSSLTERFATWNSASERGSTTQTSIPPFMGNSTSQMRDPLSPQDHRDPEIEPNVETQTAYSNHAQPRTSILSSQLPERRMDHNQKGKSDTMNKKGYRPIRTLNGHTNSVYAVAFSPNGKLLASASKDKTVGLWDVVLGATPQTFKEHTGQVHAVAFSPNGNLLASTLHGELIRLWSWGSRSTKRVLNGHTGLVNHVAFSPDGKLLASASKDKTVKLWDAGSGATLSTLKRHTDGIYTVAFSPDGKLLASASFDNTVRLWVVGSGAMLRTLTVSANLVSAVALSSDGKLLVSNMNGNVTLWDVGLGAPLHNLKGHTSWVFDAAFSTDGKLLASASVDNTVRLWNASSGALLQALNGHTGSVYAVAFSPDGKLLASSSNDRTIKLWDVGS